MLAPAKLETLTVLEIDGLSKHFGGLKAVDGVSFAVRRGSVHALIGPNGSGKTTTLNVLSGLYTPTAGRIALDGRDVTALPPHARTAAGLGRTFQNIRLFRSMTALENVVIGAERPGNELRQGHAALVDQARAALAFVGLEGRRGIRSVELFLWSSASDRDRPRARRKPDAAPSRRTGGRLEFDREARIARACSSASREKASPSSSSTMT